MKKLIAVLVLSCAAFAQQPVKVEDGSGNGITSNSTTTSSTRGLDFNILSVLGTAPTAAGFIDVRVGGQPIHLIAAVTATGSIGGSYKAIPSGSGIGTISLSVPSFSAGSMAGCQLQFLTLNGTGGGVNYGTAITLSVAQMSSGATIAVPNVGDIPQAVTQLAVNYTCSVYPSAGTMTLEYYPGLAVGILGTPGISIADGSNATLGAKADAKSTATDTTAISVMSVLKEISAMEQAPASRAVTIADGSDITLGTKTDAADAHTDGTSISVMQVLKEISAKAQSPAALPSNQSTNTAQIGGAAIVANVCQQAQPTPLAISQATASLTTIISGVSAKHVYICSIALLSATAQNINIVAGTGTNCGTTVHIGFFGGTTAATGLNLGANGGLTLGNGAAVIAGGTDTAADNICYTSSSTGQVSGVLTYVQQ